MRYTFHSEQWLPYPVEFVFAFFADPENLPRLMPPWQKARIEDAAVAPPPRNHASDPTLHLRSIAAGVGTRLTVSFKPFPFSPVRVPWEAEITDFIWNDRFCDRQLRGPFASWNHCHSVQPQPNPQTRANDAGTLLSDHIEYEMPFGKIGELAQHLIITRQLRNAFAYRHARSSDLLSRLFGRH
jgi:ligand-binding SRPBCC domain-containing protein